MGDEIRDLDDVEAQAWVSVCSRLGTKHADECVRLLRERRQGPGTVAYAVRKAIELAQAAARPIQPSTEPRDMFAVGATIERAKVVAWLRLKDEEDAWAPNSSILGCAADAIERGEHDHG